MPAEGWKALSLPDEVYEFFFQKWERNKVEYKAKYEVTSFSGWVSRILSEYIERDKKGTLSGSGIFAVPTRRER